MDTSNDRAGVAWLDLLKGPLAIFLFGAAVYFYADRSIDPPPPGQLGGAFWPKMCAVGLAVAALLKAVETFRARGLPAAEEGAACKEMDNRKLAWMILLIVLVVPAVVVLGFAVATALFIWIFLRLAGARGRWLPPSVSVGGTIFLLYLFVKIVYLPLPKGEWFFEDLTLALYRALWIM
ncbi:MAG: tripartite tricarboxylate transporter TctB family protein [Desulfobacterales bacterium]